MISTQIIWLCGCVLFVISTFTGDIQTLIAGSTLIISGQLGMLIEK